MLAGKDLLQKGLRKNIKSGFSTKVWFHNWIPTIPARPAKDNGVFRDPHLYVNHLIDFNTKEWKRDMLQELIDPADIPLITGLRPSRQFQVDDFIWVYNKSGLYTVKSGYLLASKEALASREVLEPSISKLQNQVWKTRTARKVKHFMWQALSGCIATCSRLTDRHCGRDRSCPRCGAEEESINHLLFECPPALQVWALSNIPTIPGSFPSTSLFANMDHLLWRTKEQGIAEEFVECFPWILWFIWKARNEKVFNNKDIRPPETLAKAVAESMSWKIAQTIEDELDQDEDGEQASEARVLARDLYAGIRCQSDASWSSNGKSAGLGFFVSGTHTPLLGQKGISQSLSALHAEFEGLLWAMETLLQHGHHEVKFETDCSELIKLIDQAEEWPAFSTELDIFTTTKAKFFHFSISFISRNKNIRADSLAKNARSRDILFSHVSSHFPVWMAHEAILFDSA
ncbi:uncharacterized protein LOC111832411 [Capsella rubella]|uniref:uncharacterized protein LOC111832411 n=1 Tax=Capsella rubella TaxID=81985 RepID=UPI000CD4D042|nr:uncharacterized protein LOC111832411 [Capsella rubella]